MTLGASRKQLAWLGGLGLLAAYSIYTNVLTEQESPGAARQQAEKSKNAGRGPAPGQTGIVPQSPAEKANELRRAQRRAVFAGRQSVGEFKAVFPKDKPDPEKVDPTLRTDLLAKLQNVILQGGQRSLFEIGKEPPKPAADVPKIDVKKNAAAAKGTGPGGLPAGPTLGAGEIAKAPPPAIPLKFYGFTTPRAGGAKRAFFLEGEDIHVAAEGETIKRRYKVVSVGLNSVVVEDTQYNHKQTLPLEEPPVTG